MSMRARYNASLLASLQNNYDTHAACWVVGVQIRSLLDTGFGFSLPRIWLHPVGASIVSKYSRSITSCLKMMSATKDCCGGPRGAMLAMSDEVFGLRSGVYDEPVLCYGLVSVSVYVFLEE